MTPADFRALAARVETEAPNRDLDADIWQAVGLTEAQERHCADWLKQHRETGVDRIDYLLAWGKRYTASVDAAKELMPEGWQIENMAQFDDGFAVHAARIRSNEKCQMSAAPTEPQARVALALRCRAADLEANHGNE